MCRVQILVCVLNVFSLFSNTPVLRESTCIEKRLSLIDQSNLRECMGKEEGEEKEKKKRTHQSLFKHKQQISNGERGRWEARRFRCACVLRRSRLTKREVEGREKCGGKEVEVKIRAGKREGRKKKVEVGILTSWTVFCVFARICIRAKNDLTPSLHFILLKSCIY